MTLDWPTATFDIVLVICLTVLAVVAMYLMYGRRER